MYISRLLSPLILLLGTSVHLGELFPWFDRREESGNAYVCKRNETMHKTYIYRYNQLKRNHRRK